MENVVLFLENELMRPQNITILIPSHNTTLVAMASVVTETLIHRISAISLPRFSCQDVGFPNGLVWNVSDLTRVRIIVHSSTSALANINIKQAEKV